MNGNPADEDKSMTYSCSDFTDSIIDVLEVAIPNESNDSPSDQADICLEEIRRLRAFEKAALAALDGGQEYVWRYADLNDEPDDGDCRQAHRAMLAAIALTKPETVIILRADEGLPIFKVQLQQYVEKTATAVVEAPTFKEARDKAYEIAHTLTWTDGEDSYGVEAYAVLDANGEIVWER